MSETAHILAKAYPEESQIQYLRAVYGSITIGSMLSTLEMLEQSGIPLGNTTGLYLAAAAAQNDVFQGITKPLTSLLVGESPAAAHKPLNRLTEVGLIVDSGELAVRSNGKGARANIYLPTEVGEVALGLIVP